MSTKLQNGIYYKDDHKIGNSFGILFLKFSQKSDVDTIGKKLASIWFKIKNLEKGVIEEIDTNPRNRSSGNLTALIGYNSSIFSFNGVKKKRPSTFEEKWNFIPSVKGESMPIMNGSKIHYSTNSHEDSLITDHVVIQLIADTEFYTNRALVEIWKSLCQHNQKAERDSDITLTRYYTGFHSPTGRNLIGFHDGVSNLKSIERYDNIAITRVNNSDDSWVVNGTYLGFIRIIFDLHRWEKLSRERQEIIIGRDKKTGCPLIGVTKEGKPIKDRMCPVLGTFEIIEKGNERFREHAIYKTQNLPVGVSARLLENSHIGLTNPIMSINGKSSANFKIFRQGFQFIEFPSVDQGFYVGLNFISFQNTMEKLFNVLTYSNTNTRPQIANRNPEFSFHDFFQVQAAGSFLVPPSNNNESFPGSCIFGIK